MYSVQPYSISCFISSIKDTNTPTILKRKMKHATGRGDWPCPHFEISAIVPRLNGQQSLLLVKITADTRHKGDANAKEDPPHAREDMGGSLPPPVARAGGRRSSSHLLKPPHLNVFQGIGYNRYCRDFRRQPPNYKQMPCSKSEDSLPSFPVGGVFEDYSIFCVECRVKCWLLIRQTIWSP